MNIAFRKSYNILSRQLLVKRMPMVRNAVLLDTDWMPGPYPKNEQERKAAAKKYNLLPEEYEPLDPKWDLGLGDYPHLPNRCHDDKYPYGDYEYMADARYYGEPVNRFETIFGYDGMSLNDPQFKVGWKNAVSCLGACLTIVYLIIAGMIKYRTILDRKPKHMPGQGDCYHYPTSDLSVYKLNE